MDTGEMLNVGAPMAHIAEKHEKLVTHIGDLKTQLSRAQGLIHRYHHSPVTDWKDCNVASCAISKDLVELVPEP